jgi:hypothetical protein
MNEPNNASPFFEPCEELLALLRSWQDKYGLTHEARVVKSYIEMGPEGGWERMRPGPQLRITVMLTDAKSPDRPESASFPEGPGLDLAMALGRPRVTSAEKEQSP